MKTLPPSIAAALDLHSYKAKLARARAALAGGIVAVSADQLFGTPAPVADRLIARAGIRAGHRILEPSAGTGALLRAINPALRAQCYITAIEIERRLADALRETYSPDSVLRHAVIGADFLDARVNPHRLPQYGIGRFNRIVMNPPFKGLADVKHVRHAMTFRDEDDGSITAVMLNDGQAFRPELTGEEGTGRRAEAVAELRTAVEAEGLTMSAEELPEASFASQGTNVRTVLVTIE